MAYNFTPYKPQQSNVEPGSLGVKIMGLLMQGQNMKKENALRTDALDLEREKFQFQKDQWTKTEADLGITEPFPIDDNSPTGSGQNGAANLGYPPGSSGQTTPDGRSFEDIDAWYNSEKGQRFVDDTIVRYNKSQTNPESYDQAVSNFNRPPHILKRPDLSRFDSGNSASQSSQTTSSPDDLYDRRNNWLAKNAPKLAQTPYGQKLFTQYQQLTDNTRMSQAQIEGKMALNNRFKSRLAKENMQSEADLHYGGNISALNKAKNLERISKRFDSLNIPQSDIPPGLFDQDGNVDPEREWNWIRKLQEDQGALGNTGSSTFERSISRVKVLRNQLQNAQTEEERDALSEEINWHTQRLGVSENADRRLIYTKDRAAIESDVKSLQKRKDDGDITESEYLRQKFTLTDRYNKIKKDFGQGVVDEGDTSRSQVLVEAKIRELEKKIQSTTEPAEKARLIDQLNVLMSASDQTPSASTGATAPSRTSRGTKWSVQP